MAAPRPGEYPSPIPGGGSQYLYRRVDDASGAHILCLGVGGFGHVLDCWRELGGVRTPVAIKQLSVSDKRAADLAESIEMRGLIGLASRKHPRVVQFISSFRGDEGGGRVRLSFVFERCPLAVSFPLPAQVSSRGLVVPSESGEQPELQGCDLTSNPHKKGPYTSREARHVIRQLLEAAAYFHASTPPLVHRDIKPDNVLIWAIERDAATGEQLLEVKLTDFGTMRAQGGEMTVGQGTRCFMAHEVEEATGVSRSTKTPGRPVGAYDTSVDVFSIGATYFYLRTGEAPSGATRKPWDVRMGKESFVSSDLARSYYTQYPLLRRRARDAASAAVAAPQQPPQPSGGSGGGFEFSLSDATSSLSLGGGARGSADSGGSAGTGEAVPASGAHVSSKKTPLPPVTLLDYYFPPDSRERAFLEGLVHDAGGGGRRFTASEAIAFLDGWES